MIRLRSERLMLLPLPLEALKLLSVSRSDMELHLGWVQSDLELESEIQAEMEDALNFWLRKVEEHPDSFCWYTNWEIVLASENRSIGGIGLAGEPDAAGEVEIGYALDRRYRNRGYMTETLELLLRWIFVDPRARAVRAQTPAANRPSQIVLERNGFTLREKGADPLLWQLPRAVFEARFDVPAIR